MDSLMRWLGSCICYENIFSKYIVPEVSINGQQFIIERLLNEDSNTYRYAVSQKMGTSHIYSNQDGDSMDHSGMFLLKKISCFTIDDVKNALTEINYYKNFNSEYIIKLVDYQLVQQYNGLIHGVPEIGSDERYSISLRSVSSTNNISKVCSILFPYYSHGTIEDLINKTIINNELILTERQIVEILLGLAKAIQHLHHPEMMSQINDLDNNNNVDNISIKNKIPSLVADTPLETLWGGDIENSNDETNTPSKAYIHMNLTPSNIFIKSIHNSNDLKDYTSIIGDLRYCIQQNQVNNSIQFKEWLESISSVEFKSPELINIHTDQITTKTDIWSFGCLAYYLIYGISPFKREEQTKGASLAYSIKIGSFSFPNENEQYSDIEYNNRNELNKIISDCINTSPQKRPDIDSLVQTLTTILSQT